MERVLYCHCAFARVIAPHTKAAVLSHLAAGDRPFDAVPDLCEMSARRDERLRSLASATPLVVVACYARAVHGLFHSAGAPLPESGVTVLNMRADSAETVMAQIDELAERAGEPSEESQRADKRSEVAL